MKDGYLDIPQGPGLWITLDMDFVRKHVSLSFMYQLRTWVWPRSFFSMISLKWAKMRFDPSLLSHVKGWSCLHAMLKVAT